MRGCGEIRLIECGERVRRRVGVLRGWVDRVCR